MKRGVLLLFGLCLFSLSAMAQAPAGDSQKQAEEIKQLTAEVKQLRLGLLAQSVEFQQWKLRQIERELHRVQTEAERLDGEERAIQAELAALSSEVPKESESYRAESIRQLQRLQTRQQPVRECVADLSAEQNREESRLRQLSARLKAEGVSGQ